MTSTHVAVLAGGFPTEWPLPLSSARACATALDEEALQASFVDVDHDVADILASALAMNKEQARKIVALAAHREIGCHGVSRSDFRYNDRAADGEIIRLEIGNQPGMTSTPLVPDIAAQSGPFFAKLVRWIVEDASCHQ